MGTSAQSVGVRGVEQPAKNVVENLCRVLWEQEAV